MAEKQPILVVFDIDGTLVNIRDVDVGTVSDIYADDALMRLTPYPNIVGLVKQYIERQNTTVLFCTGRPKRAHSVTRRWLNKHVGLNSSGKRVTLVCRPDDTPEANIPTFKLGEIVQAVRRVGSKPSEARIYDDEFPNLRVFETLRPMVHSLQLFHASDGVVSQWSP